MQRFIIKNRSPTSNYYRDAKDKNQEREIRPIIITSRIIKNVSLDC